MPRPPWPERRQGHPPCCLPREGRGTDRGKATARRTGPLGRTVGENGAQAAPPKPQPPALERPIRRDPPHGEPTAPSQVGGKRDRPPPLKQTKQSTGPMHDTRRGTDRVERPHQRAAPGPHKVRAPQQPREGGGGTEAAGAQAHTHTKDTRGIPEGQPDRARGTHRPRGMAYQRARIRDTRTGRPATHSAGNDGQQGRNGEDTTPGTGPSPRNQPRAPRTHEQGTAPAKAVVAHRATHKPQG